jgi:hypothetical protein
LNVLIRIKFFQNVFFRMIFNRNYHWNFHVLFTFFGVKIFVKTAQKWCYVLNFVQIQQEDIQAHHTHSKIKNIFNVFHIFVQSWKIMENGSWKLNIMSRRNKMIVSFIRFCWKILANKNFKHYFSISIVFLLSFPLKKITCF